MSHLFNIDGLSDRENAIAQLVAGVVLEEEGHTLLDSIKTELAINENQIEQIKEGIKKFEHELTNSDGSLADLLANTAKSACCS